ncbi:MAG: hypothetical protein K9H64_13275 [Bacteroidales bacterium]|nr:hypothetical protein [Bacteroidales bacterium]MCF8456980.1 hypothetical protein [Bacteroidales bacterium]
MEDPNCPNYTTCKLVTTDDLKLSREKKVLFMNQYCTTGRKAWESCKRYTTKATLGFCPDFVLPDSDYTLSEIVDKIDTENEL